AGRDPRPPPRRGRPPTGPHGGRDRARPAPDPRRARPAETALPESVPERSGSHDRGRNADDHRPGRPGARGPGPGHGARDRHRARNPPRGPRPGLRAVLHHEVERNGARARDLPQHRGRAPGRSLGGPRTSRDWHDAHRAVPHARRLGHRDHPSGADAVRTIRVLSRDAGLTARLHRLLNGSLDLGPGGSLPQALDPGVAQADVLLLDFGSSEVDADELAAAATNSPRPFLVGLLAPDEPVPPGAERCDLALPRDLPEAALRLAVEQGLRMRRLELEVASLRRERAHREPAVPPANGHGSGTAIGTVLKELGKLLGAHFDIERVVEFFLDAVAELARPVRVALLLVDNDHRYRPRGLRGLDPDLAERLRLKSGEGLADWFRQHVRLAVRSELEREPDWLEAARELALLGGDVA